MRASLLAAILPFVVCTAPAQIDRHELGLRLRAFERRLHAADDPARRAAAFAELDRAVQAFFRLDTRSVAKAIDAADVALGAADSPAHRAARSLQVVLDARLVAADAPAIAFRVAAAYPTDEPEASSAGLALRIEALVPGAAAVTLAIAGLPHAGELPLVGVPAGDHVVRWSVVQGEDVLVRRELFLSRVADLEDRLAALEKAAAAAEAVAPPTIESKTLPALVKLLRGMQRRRAEETVLPATRLCAEAEALAAATTPWYGPARSGDFHLRVPLGAGTAAVRLFAPAVADGRRPLVVALHGAGGSENLFFDGYGDGLVVALAAERGWFVVAPRLAIGGVDGAALVDALAARFPIDRDRVLLVGHSMGAMQAVQQAMAAPGRYRAVAALGGGGRVAARAGLAALPFFVGAGERDFARAGARQLHDALLAAGVASTWREYPAVEHLAIVQVALPDVFVFFAEALAGRR